MSDKKEIRDKVLAAICIVLILCGFYGMHNDWTTYILIIPFGWIILGVIFDGLVNEKGTRESGIISIACALILVNLAVILVHRDTPFIIGRLLCCVGLSVLIIRTSTERF